MPTASRPHGGSHSGPLFSSEAAYSRWPSLDKATFFSITRGFFSFCFKAAKKPKQSAEAISEIAENHVNKLLMHSLLLWGASQAEPRREHLPEDAALLPQAWPRSFAKILEFWAALQRLPDHVLTLLHSSG